MKKLISVLIALVIIVAIVLLALPKYFSTQGNQYVQGFLQGLEQGSNGVVTGKVVKSSEGGWFSSEATVEIDYKLVARDKTKSDKTISGKFDLDLNTHYGPILMTNNGLSFGRAYIAYDLKNNKDSAKFFKGPLITGDATISFNGKTRVEISGLQAAKNDRVAFSGLKADFTINRQLTSSQGTIHFNQLQVTAKNNKNEGVVFAPFIQTFSMTRPTAKDLWSGSKTITFPSIAINSPEFNGQFSDVTIKSNAMVNQKTLNGNLIINAPTFTANKHTGNFHATMTLKDLNATAIYKLRDLADSMRNQNLTNQQVLEMSDDMFNFMIDMFSGKSSIQFDSKLSISKLGNFILNTGYDNSTPDSKVNFTAQVDRANKKIAGIDLKIEGLNKSTLGKLMHMAANVDTNSNTTTISPQVLKTKVSQLLPKLFTPASQINLNVMLPEGNDSGYQLLNAKAYFNQLPQNPTMADLVTKSQLDASWKIPTYATDMLQLFAPMIISKMQDVDKQTQAKSAYDMFKEIMPLMIQQGYLEQQGKYYISDWNISRNGVLMNNKPVQPLLEEVGKMQQQKSQAAQTQADTGPATQQLPAEHPSLNSPVLAPKVVPMMPLTPAQPAKNIQ